MSSEKKIGVVSSFDVLCGNAAYSQALVSGMRQAGHDVMSIDIPVELQKTHNRQDITSILQQVRDCDAINIQMELSLYGPTPRSCAKLLKRIIRNAKTLSITMHRVEVKPVNLIKSTYQENKQSGIFSALKQIIIYWMRSYIFRQYAAVIRAGYNAGATFIIHTYREEKRIKRICPKAKTIVHPIVWQPDMETGTKTETAIDIKTKFKTDKPIVGLFGFISPYKNYDFAAKSLLAHDFNLVVAGGMHPTVANYGQRTTSANKSLHAFVMLNEILEAYKGQTYVYTAPDDATLIRLIRSVDVVAIPYLEVGQSSSGIASLAIQYGKRIVFADTHLITELVPFLNKRPFVFDVAASTSLVSAVEQCLEEDEKSIYFNGYDFSTNITANLHALQIED